MRLRGIKAMRERRKSKKKEQPSDKCLFHSALDRYCTCLEENRPATSAMLGEKIASEIDWRRRCVAINPFMFQKEAEEISEIESIFR